MKKSTGIIPIKIGNKIFKQILNNEEPLHTDDKDGFDMDLTIRSFSF